MTDTILRASEEAVALAKEFRKGGFHEWAPLTAREIKDIRSALDLSQPAFAERYGFDLGSLRNWEQGRRIPGRNATMMLLITQYEPKALAELIKKVKHMILQNELEAV